MWVRGSSKNQKQLDPEWIREFERFLNERDNKEKFEVVKKVFVETYLENIREGMKTKDALQKAKEIAQCFLLLQ
jgi:hypothetical protein